MEFFKRLTTMSLSAAIVLSVLTGCGTQPATPSSSTSQASSTSSVATEPSQKEYKPVKYTIMMNQAIAEYPPDGGEAKKVLQARWEKDLGITNTDFEVLLVGGGDYNTKLNAMMSGGDAPDFFFVKVEDLETMVKNKVVVPIDDYVATMPNFQERLKQTAAKASYDNFVIDGKHYGFVETALEGALNNPGVNGLIMRTDWLEKLGMKQPTTVQELHDVLVAFTNQDPDGNGQKDTYGFGGAKDQFFSSVFGAYGVYMSGINSWVERDGKLVHSTVLPETKEVLATLQAWYKEGLIDPDKFVIEGKQCKDKFIGSKIGAYENSIWWANDARVAWNTSDPKASCAMLQPPTGSNGKKGFPVSIIKTNAMVLSKNAAENKDPERLIAILDWMLSDAENGGQQLVQYGEEGKHYTYDKEKNFIDNSIMGDAVNLYKLGYSNPVRWLGSVDRRWIAKGDPREVDFGVTNNEANWLTSPFVGSVPAMKDYPDLYNKLWAEYFTKIVTGALSVDAFDEYVTKFEKQGGQELTEQVNAAWAATK